MATGFLRILTEETLAVIQQDYDDSAAPDFDESLRELYGRRSEESTDWRDLADEYGVAETVVRKAYYNACRVLQVMPRNAPLDRMYITAYEVAGFKRWTGTRADRLYLDVRRLKDLKVAYYKTGSVKDCLWCGERVSNSEGCRFLASSIWVDVTTGMLHVDDRTSNDWHARDMPTLLDKAEEYVGGVSWLDAVETERRRMTLVQDVASYTRRFLETVDAVHSDSVKKVEEARDITIDAIESADVRSLREFPDDPQRLISRIIQTRNAGLLRGPRH